MGFLKIYLLFGITRAITARLHDINLACRKKFDQKKHQIDSEIWMVKLKIGR